MEFPGWNAYMKSHNFVHIFAASKFTIYFSDKIFRLLLSEAITLSKVSLKPEKEESGDIFIDPANNSILARLLCFVHFSEKWGPYQSLDLFAGS
jgi:hypothetical protein